MKRITRAGSIALVLSAMCAAAWSDDAISVRQSQLDFFESRIRPVLVEHCYECHSADAKKVKGGLRLDSGPAMHQGGDSGPAIVAGNPDASLLLEALRYESVEMPPRGKLPDATIDDFGTWIKMGAPDPRTDTGPETLPSDTDAGKDHWAFQPIRQPTAPQVRDTTWPRSPADYFVLARLEQEQLSPAPDADRHTWLRRVTFDITGLPPTAEEIEAYLSDDSPRAAERVVDRLLASRAFGERWARHWLDLVGYADQIGTSNNVFAEHAWRYRDYVVDAFNHDLPYDQFILQQLAGDLLPSSDAQERAAGIVATGFLVLGDVEIVEADKAKMRVDIVDQQLVKTGKAFLGMTLGCARCHDHKFDPISQHEYYAMAGYFYNTQSVYKTDRGVWSDVLHRELPETDSQRAARTLQAEEHHQQMEQWREEKAGLEKELDEIAAQLEATPDEAKQELTKRRDASRNRVNSLNRAIAHGAFFTPGVPRTYGVQDREACTDMRITIRGNPHALGDTIARGFLRVATPSGKPTDDGAADDRSSGRVELAKWIASEDNPLTARVVVNRIWQKLFGSGLVGSVDYLGIRGERPTHPELLDHLVTRFLQQGWSQKTLIRELVLSRTYGMSSDHEETAHRLDPDNKLYWRMNRRRLDAEAIRDAMLAASGQLQASSGGPALPLEFVQNVGNLDPADVNPPSFSLQQYRPQQPFERTVYLPVIRSGAQKGPAALRNIFDFPQPAQFRGQRPVTAVPTQALFLMNSPEVHTHAQRLAQRVERETADEDADSQIHALWMFVLNRPPTSEESRDAGALLVGESLTELCRALLATNEFLMIL